MFDLIKHLNKNSFLKSKLDSRLRGNDVRREILAFKALYFRLLKMPV